jgi:hypothetical protein
MTDSITKEMEPNDPEKSKEEYVQHGLKNLREFDLTPVTERVERRRDTGDSTAEELEDKFKKFTLMTLKERGPDDDPDKEIAPSDALDEYWHEFLLDTRRYHEYCDYVFGYFMHHNPEPKLKRL